MCAIYVDSGPFSAGFLFFLLRAANTLRLYPPVLRAVGTPRHLRCMYLHLRIGSRRLPTTTSTSVTQTYSDSSYINVTHASHLCMYDNFRLFREWKPWRRITTAMTSSHQRIAHLAGLHRRTHLDLLIRPCTLRSPQSLSSHQAVARVCEAFASRPLEGIRRPEDANER